MADVMHKKNETGMPHTTLYTRVANLNLGVIRNMIIVPLFHKSTNYFVDLIADAKAHVRL